MIDRKTRGRTSPRRLRALDAFLVRAEQELIREPPSEAAFVDVGFGEHPWTTIESAAALRKVHPGIPVIGLERDPARVTAAGVHTEPRTRFLPGGFERLTQLAPARIVRAMNVLRTYPEPEARDAHALLGAPLIEGGLVLEGSADPDGGILTCHLLRRRGPALVREGLLFFTDFSHGFAPIQLRDWLPRDLRRRVLSGEWIREFLDAWTRAWTDARAGRDEPQEVFVASIEALAANVPGVCAEPEWTSRGYLIFRPPGGVPIPR